MTQTQEHEEQTEQRFYLYPVITVDAEDEDDATRAVIDAIFHGGVGEIPGWLPEPPDRGHEHRQEAALEAASVLLRTVWDTLRHGLTDGQREALQEAGNEARDALAAARGT